MGVKLSVRDLSFSYGNVRVLNDVSFDLDGGSIACLVGPNGAGKSTLIRCIANVLSPKDGTVRINGADAVRMKPAQLAKTTGYVPQSIRNGFPHTVFDEVLVGRRPYIGWKVADADIGIVSDTLAFLGLAHLSERYFDELSGGERQKVTIARALAQEPAMLLLDEPTSNLDIRHQLEVMEMLTKLAEDQSLLVLMAMHDLNLAARYSDVVLMMRGNTVNAVGHPSEVLVPQAIEATYGVRAQIIDGPLGKPHIVPIEPTNNGAAHEAETTVGNGEENTATSQRSQTG